MPTTTAKNLYTLIARDVSTDVADNMTSINKIIDKFTFGVDLQQLAQNQAQVGEKTIALPANYAIATTWLLNEKLSKDTFFNFKIAVIDPKGKNLGGPEQENLIPKGSDRINMNFNMQGLPVTEKGIYVLRAEIAAKNGKALAHSDYPFEIELVEGIQQQI